MSLIALKRRKCQKAVDTQSFTLDYVPDYYKTHTMCEKAVSEEPFMFEDLDNAVYFCQYFNTGSLDDNNFNHDDPETIILVRTIAWCNKYKQHKACIKDISKKLVPVAWDSRSKRDYSISNDEKKEINKNILD